MFLELHEYLCYGPVGPTTVTHALIVLVFMESLRPFQLFIAIWQTFELDRTINDVIYMFHNRSQQIIFFTDNIISIPPTLILYKNIQHTRGY